MACPYRVMKANGAWTWQSYWKTPGPWKKKQQSRTPSPTRKRWKLVNPQSNSETCSTTSSEGNAGSKQRAPQNAHNSALTNAHNEETSIPKIVSDVSISPFMLSHVPWWRLSSTISSSVVVSSTWREKDTCLECVPSIIEYNADHVGKLLAAQTCRFTPINNWRVYARLL